MVFKENAPVVAAHCALSRIASLKHSTVDQMWLLIERKDALRQTLLKGVGTIHSHGSEKLQHQELVDAIFKGLGSEVNGYSLSLTSQL